MTVLLLVLGASTLATAFFPLARIRLCCLCHVTNFACRSGIGMCWASAPVSFLLSLLLPVAAAAFLLRLSARHVALLQQQHSRALQDVLRRATGALAARAQLRSLNGEALEVKAFDSGVQLPSSLFTLI